MLVVVVAAVIGVALADCDISQTSEGDRDTALRLCKLESEVLVLENALQELLQRTDMTVGSGEVHSPQKRKNEFIRFGKRSATNEKRKNEFIRFGKRKNEFIRFGRSLPQQEESMTLNKRKNEFIRFG